MRGKSVSQRMRTYFPPDAAFTGYFINYPGDTPCRYSFSPSIYKQRLFKNVPVFVLSYFSDLIQIFLNRFQGGSANGNDPLFSAFASYLNQLLFKIKVY